MTGAFWRITDRLRVEGDIVPRFEVSIVRASSWAEAQALLGSTGPGDVAELVTPCLVDAAAERAPGEVWQVWMRRTPSVYDQFHRGYTFNRRGRLRSLGYDYRAMEEAGFDVS